MTQLSKIDIKLTSGFQVESEVEAYSDKFLRDLGFALKHKKTGNKIIDVAWPSKTAAAKAQGKPDIFVYLNDDASLPFCVWENKGPNENALVALAEAKFYVEGIHLKHPTKPSLPRLAVGFDGRQLLLSYYNHNQRWTEVKVDGSPLVNAFPLPAYASNGFSSNGNFLAAGGAITAADLRRALPALKTLYRSIPILASGRRAIDFTVALLTLKMLVEIQPEWGTWAEQPSLVPDSQSLDHAVAERLMLLADRVLASAVLKKKYGDIFRFKENAKANQEVAFDFKECLTGVERGNDFYARMFQIMDELPPLHGADFDIFGEVYQTIGDDDTKRALGEFFTGRHIISGVIPVFFERAGVTDFNAHISGKRIADTACGTGGFLTESLRYMRKRFDLDENQTRSFAKNAFFGYDLSRANASRARVNMYFAGDGFSEMEGGVDSLSKSHLPAKESYFDFIVTNPPYGSSNQYQRLEEAFLTRIIASLKPGSGWGLVVLPVGVIENPRSSGARFELLKAAKVTDVITLPPHSFAPYTKQQTAVIIFQRRSTPLPVSDWAGLFEEIGTEEISMFVVDNDGFANSDKRYVTDRVSITGEWLHNDFKAWINTSNGRLQRSKLHQALIHNEGPTHSSGEFGEPLGAKYGRFTLKALFKFQNDRGARKDAGIELLPDTYLRPSYAPLELAEFVKQATEVIASAKSPLKGGGDASLKDAIRNLLSSPVKHEEKGVEPAFEEIERAFDPVKGDTGLTESIIYQQFDPQGLPVYGGGESSTNFFIKKGAKTKGGVAVKTHVGPALIVSMDGSSGSTRVVPSGEFACNHHACVLKPKKEITLDLYFVAQQIEGALKSLSSNKGSSATLTKPTLSSLRFQLLASSDMNRVGELREELCVLQDRFR